MGGVEGEGGVRVVVWNLHPRAEELYGGTVRSN